MRARVISGLIAVTAIGALAACSSSSGTASTETAPPTNAAPSSSTASAGAVPSSAASTAASASPSAAASGGSGFMGDSLARAAMPKKEDIQNVVGAAVPKAPDIATYSDKDLTLSATAEPPSCTDVYALVWALTVPKDTKTFTGASYAIGNSAIVVSIADAGLTLEQAKAAIDKCPTFSVQRTAASNKYTVGDMLTQFTTKAELVTPDSLAIVVGTRSQVLTDTSDACLGGATISPSCVQTQSESVNQVLRREGPNLISVWGITTTDVAGSAAADTPITLPEVASIADGVQSTVRQLTK